MKEPNRTVIDRVDWESVLPVLRLVSAFKHALQPGKILVALVAILAIHFSGLLLGELFDETASAETEVSGFAQAFDARSGIESGTPYESVVAMQARAFGELTRSAFALDHGFGPGEPGVADALSTIFMGIPARLFDEHPWFTLLFGADVLFVLLLASGVISRMAATQVCQGQSRSTRQALGFVYKRWAWYVISPLMPALLILFVGGLLALAGLVFFNVPWLDVIGSLLYGPLMIGGLVIALVTLLLVLSLCLMPPALSVEGTDGFDAVSRSFNYVLFKPWRFAGYTLSAMVYLAAVSVVVGTLAGFTFSATYSFVDVGAVSDLHASPPIADGSEPVSVLRHDIIISGVEAAERSDSSSVMVSAWIVARWFELLTAVVLAVLFSTFCCLQTQVYMLMRRSADGTPMDQCDGDEDDAMNSCTPAEPVAPAEQAGVGDEAKAEG